MVSRNIELGMPTDYDDRKEQMAVDLAERLRKTFHLRLDNNPAVTARALEIYSSRLPGRLILEWGPEYQIEEEGDDEEDQDADET